MSFISVLGTSKYVTVVSDGLVVDTHTGEHLEANYKKFSKISNKQFIAYGGHRYFAEKLVEGIGYHEKEINLQSLAHDIRDIIIRDIPPEEGSCQVIIGGVENSDIIFYSFNNNPEQELLIQKPSGDTPEYSTISVGTTALKIEHEINKLHPPGGVKSPSRALKLQKRLNDIIASVDSTVNKRTFSLTIRND